MLDSVTLYTVFSYNDCETPQESLKISESSRRSSAVHWVTLACEREVVGLLRLGGIGQCVNDSLDRVVARAILKSLTDISSGLWRTLAPLQTSRRVINDLPWTNNNEHRKPRLQQKRYMESEVGSLAMNKKDRGQDWSAELLITSPTASPH